MLIDSHLHFPTEETEIHKIIERAVNEGVTKFINIGTSLIDSEYAIKTAGKFESVYASVAVYPHEDMDKEDSFLVEGLRKLAGSSKKVVAIGECGIDISNWRGGRSLDNQITLFDAQVRLALELNLPLIIHNRNGDEIVFQILKKNRHDTLRGVAHCFASSWDFAQKLLDLGFYVSFSGMITYPNKSELLEVVGKVPLGRFLVETDSPYLPPQGHRGEKNEPKYVKMIAQKVADIKNLPLQSIEDHAYDNTNPLFHL